MFRVMSASQLISFSAILPFSLAMQGSYGSQMIVDAFSDSAVSLLVIFWSVLASIVVAGVVWVHYVKKLR
jgi:hypothetical protein